ncbi:DUF4256 domain-containing protein [Planococcus sp. YIM B11945]|uniref:DUF4256 domain-containing protein n=1 Tax=Planococcus sp. YIM B11945 TaxID=3435410 RepID=UPI003D7D077F
MDNKELTQEQRAELLGTLKARFENNIHRHEKVVWDKVQAKLEVNADKLWSLQEMERTGGEPDVVGFDEATGEFLFFDCSKESPAGRRSLCFDQEALDSRKKNKPEDSAVNLAAAMGIELLTEDEYRALQELEHFDLKTSSWVQTPPDIRERSGAIFCDCRYGRVFMYHNGADSYYAARGFRGVLKI